LRKIKKPPAGGGLSLSKPYFPSAGITRIRFSVILTVQPLVVQEDISAWFVQAPESRVIQDVKIIIQSSARISNSEAKPGRFASTF
jgi:hypothetical protein